LPRRDHAFRPAARLSQLRRAEYPTEYIRFALEASQGDWLPLFYFARSAGLTQPGLVDFINAI
jgi:hypothetical protein